jgi:N12 class adenine-specific DNA methylase
VAQNPFQSSPFSSADFADTPEEAIKPRAATPAPASKSGATAFDPLFERYGKQYDLPPTLLKTLAGKESSFNPKAVGATNSNGSTDYGLMQHNSRYIKERGITDWSDPEQSVAAAAKLLRQNLAASGGDLREAVRRYNGSGPAAERYADDVMAKFQLANGDITSSEYARLVANRARPSRFPNSAKPASIDDQFSDTPEGAVSPAASDFVDTPEEAKGEGSGYAMPQLAPTGPIAETQADIENKPYLDRLTEETKSGFGDMTRSLTTARWALGAGDAKTLAEDLAQSFQEQANKPKTKAQQEIDAAYKGVSDAKGVIDTTVAGAGALWASLTNPKETSIEIARNAANSLPTLAGGAAGAGGGALAGSVVPGYGTAAGAILGGRAGMAAGTTATELGAEIQDMVQKRLAEAKQPPTAQNILALLSDKDFQSAALKQGAAKGLTVAAIDQLFMGLGGKIATAPARKIATKEFAEAGIDMSTRAARKEALNTAAGQAAIAAAKPSVGAKVAAGGAAVAVDAAGESIGEGVSQQVARGEVDYGEALREGVVSIGQSAAQTAAGTTIEQAKVAARAAKGAMQPAPAAPSTASGPLARATENAAVTPERVTVTAADGQVSGTVTGQTADAVEIVGDDGQVYAFKTGPDGVKITPEAPNTPLTNALEVAANDNADQAPVPAPVQAPDAQGPADVQASPAPAAAQPGEAVAPAKPEPSPALSEQPTAPVLAEMDEPALRERLKYIADQAKTNGGWNSMLTKARREVEKEINARVPKVETPAPQASLDLVPADSVKAEVKAAEPVAQATPAQQAATKLPKDLAGAKERYNYGNKGFELKFGNDVDRAAFMTAQTPNSKRDADYLAFAMQASGMSEDEVRAHGRAIKDTIKGMAKDASPGTLKVPEVARGVTVEKTPAPTAEAAPAVAPVSQPAASVATEVGAGGSQPSQAAPAKPTKLSKAEEEHLFGTDKKRAAALKRIEGGTAYFGSAEKAKDFIAKNGLKDTHTVEQTGKVRFEVKAKAENVTDERTSGKPASAEAVEQKADAGQAKAAPVQPAATEEVSAEQQAKQEFIEALKISREKLPAGFEIQTERDSVALKENGRYAVTGLGRTSAGVLEALRQAELRAANAKKAAEPNAMAQGAEAAKSGAERTPPAGLTDKAAFEWMQGYDSQAGTTPAAQQPKTDTSQFAGNKIFTEDAVAKARARMKSKLGNLNAGIDPEMIMDGMTIAGAYIEAGTRSFAAYAKAMTDDFGPKIKPYLLSFYEAARNYPGLDTEGLTPVADAKAEFDALNANEVAPVAGLFGGGPDPKNTPPMQNLNGFTVGDVVNVPNRTIGQSTIELLYQRQQVGMTMDMARIINSSGKKLDLLTSELTKADTQLTSTKAEGNDNEPQQLDQSGSRELAGQQSDAVQGAEPQRKAGDSAQGSGGTDVSGSERAGSSRTQPAGRVGNDAGEVPSLAARRNAGRGGQPGGEPVQRGQRAAKPNPASAERDTGNQPSLIPETGTRAQDRADGFVITDEDAIGEGGQKTKFKQNVAAIRLLKQLTAENRQATRAEQAVLAKYVGWGGIPQAFYRDNNEVTKGWEKEAAELKEVLTPEELAAAASSTRNAHYTSTEIVQAVWDAVKHFGFQGGRVLEPSLGVGNFYGLMPTALRSASQLTGVELDHITGGIAKQLYPQANIAAPVGFQDFSAPDNYFELAIGNPPFGREGIYDAIRRKISGFSIHNYFFAKSIDTVKPNGVLAMVVTNRLLDSMGDKARAYIADRAEFLGAIRLPNDAFAKNAGTQVTTDIIFLRKLKEGEQATGQSWMNVRQYKDKDGNTVPLNEYFVRNPDMMLGDFGQYGSMYSAEDAALVARPGQDTPALLQAAIAKLPKGFMDAPTAEPVRETIEPLHDISRVKVGSVFEQGGEIFERREDMLGKQQAAPVVFASDKAKDRVTGMIKVRDALIEVRGLQLQEGVSDKALETARAALNKEYDAFVKANGPINADANKRLMRDDPTWPQLAALEDKFDKGVSAAVAKTTGEKARAPSAEKSAIFSKRTQAPYKAPEKATSAKDAMVSSLAERGRVDLDYMASLYGKTPEHIAQELEGLIFKNPTGGWESRDQYLSGNVKKKLAQAIDAAKADPSLKANVDALKAVQPADIEAVDIDVKTGAHWVPADVMQGFITHISEGQNAKALYNPVAASWTLNVERVPQSAMTQWSTDRANILAVLEAAANQKQITIYDKFSDGSRTLNEAATTAANEKVERVKAEWKNWIWADDARRERLARIYNDTFNTDQQREFDGSHLKFPGKVGDDIIQLRPHQANAVWRMVQSGTTLLDHVVGAGKTFTMIAGIMEMRRMGLAKKPMLVVPNHLVGQWAEDFMKLYPGANILAATKKDFEKDSRKRLFARIATGDWDAVIVAHSSFGKVEVEPEFQEAFIKQQIADMDTSIKAMREAEGKGSRNVKQIEKQKAALEEKLKKLFDTGSKDDNLHFGELGVDAVLLDEAHEFKNLGFSTSMQRVAGLGNPAGSNKAADMFMKVQATLQRTGGKNVVFATGTPISNTMAEMYTMQRFLDYGTLKDQGIAHFDAWAKTFGEVVTDWELSPSGQYKMNSRFAKFVNMPELMQRYGSFADVINRDDINRQLAEQGKKLPVPKVAGGKPENTVVERSRDQAQYIGIPTVDDNGVESYPEGSLVYRAENIPKKAEKGADNMLKIMSDARKAALDMRLIDPSYPDNPGSKVNVAANNIKALYDQWTKDKGTQLVFCDLSTPKGAVAKEAAALRELVKLAEDGDEAAQSKLDAMSPDELLALDSQFSVYDDLKAKLIAKGIPENEIAFIHDAGTDLQKQELFAKVRTGRVRVLIGSTSKMGAGMNVQDRLVALHHLDAPWRPSDLEQREGRIIRQGNRLYEANPEGFEVAIKRYATKQTLDSRMWQTIEAKARFIEQVRKGTGEREVEDVAGEAANSAEMKAASSGNPLILEEMSLRQAIRKLENQQGEHNREQFRIKDRMRMLADGAKRFDQQAVELNADAPLAPKEFALTVGNQTFDKQGEAGDAILAAVNAMHAAREDSREIGTYGGFKLTIDDTSSGLDLKAVVTLQGQGEYQVDANPGSSGVGLGQRIANTVRNLKAEADRVSGIAERNRADIPKLEQQIKPWGQEAELNEAKARHAAVIEQLKPKKKPEAAKPEGDVRMSRAGDLEAVFEGLESRGLARKRTLDALANNENAETINYIENNFWDILGELEDKGLVEIKC